jgi:tetratricopeptide (TPR) repeat protein
MALEIWQRRSVVAAAGLLTGALAGFFGANAYGPAMTRTTAPPAASQTAPKDEPNALSLGEIKNAVAAADAKPDDAAMQRKLGLGLYQYSRLTPQEAYLQDVARLLRRANKAAPEDREVSFALGNTLFALARDGDAGQFAAARQVYEQMLARQKNDAEARAALGLTYLFDATPQNARAAQEFRAALQADSSQQDALQGLTLALINLGQREEAQQRLDELALLNPRNPALNALRVKLAGQPLKAAH